MAGSRGSSFSMALRCRLRLEIGRTVRSIERHVDGHTRDTRMRHRSCRRIDHASRARVKVTSTIWRWMRDSTVSTLRNRHSRRSRNVCSLKRASRLEAEGARERERDISAVWRPHIFVSPDHWRDKCTHVEPFANGVAYKVSSAGS